MGTFPCCSVCVCACAVAAAATAAAVCAAAACLRGRMRTHMCACSTVTCNCIDDGILQQALRVLLMSNSSSLCLGIYSNTINIKFGAALVVHQVWFLHLRMVTLNYITSNRNELRLESTAMEKNSAGRPVNWPLHQIGTI
eukprot:1159394-Pelagomonas_calceolata.AAC.8